MGLNLCVRRLSINDEGVCGGTKNYEDFDTDKYVGDRELAGSGLLDQHIWHERDEQSYYRPSNFDKVRDWINVNIEMPGNKERLFNILNVMEQDASLYFYYSM